MNLYTYDIYLPDGTLAHSKASIQEYAAYLIYSGTDYSKTLAREYLNNKLTGNILGSKDILPQINSTINISLKELTQ